MTTENFNWQGPATDPEDQILIDEYQRVGVPLDSLAYTTHFKDLVRRIGRNPDQDADLRRVFLRLLGLRKRGLLPRLYHGNAVTEETP